MPVEPFVQVRGTDPVTNALTYYKADQNGYLVAKFSDAQNKWLDYETDGPFLRPGDLAPALNENDKQQLAIDMINSGLFKPKTEYMLVGDEPRGGHGVVDISAILKPDEVEKIKKLLVMMPRMMLREWFDTEIGPTLPGMAFQVWDNFYGRSTMRKKSDEMVWAAFLDLFNQANLEYVNREQIEPWEWEQEKYESFLISQNAPAMQAIETEIKNYEDVDLALDPKAKKIIEEFLTLPKLGDPGLEVNRQNSIKELLKRKEYVLAQAIVDAFRYASQTELGETMTQPIPYDIVAPSGQVVKATRR